MGADDVGADDVGADDVGADDVGADDVGADDVGADAPQVASGPASKERARISLMAMGGEPNDSTTCTPDPVKHSYVPPSGIQCRSY
ncbi:hypothetical protein [Geodermatophilus normandii]|uniref:hypothetical protein n=1 Tax=Geodermatophilus normandii TaxID=1137989 RepID=UPI0011B6FC30|nr:hypothetical protein [Geodermatophilus normandii]